VNLLESWTHKVENYWLFFEALIVPALQRSLYYANLLTLFIVKLPFAKSQSNQAGLTPKFMEDTCSIASSRM
jgi:hypothetical protein